MNNKSANKELCLQDLKGRFREALDEIDIKYPKVVYYDDDVYCILKAVMIERFFYEKG